MENMRTALKVFIFLCAAFRARANPVLIQGNSSCGYSSCPTGNPDMLNVHLVCHTHDDIGWIKSVDEYYYGASNDERKAGVQYILDSVTDELLENAARKFIYVESAFVWRWWSEQSESTKTLVQNLVNTGQLEFIGGGWSMNDEAATHYVDIIDQMTLGLRILNDSFGECATPRVAWHIDPFGHSREQASLFSQMGFDAVFFGRIDHDDKRVREKSKTMEMLWEASANIDEATLFTSVLPNLYHAPTGLCFDDQCYDEPIMDNPNFKDYNVERKVNHFIDRAQEQAAKFATNHIIMTMGGDFQYQNANTWYKNLDKLIKYVNERQSNGSQVNAFYSTPSCYAQALNNLNYTWPTKVDDFLPYADDRQSYWTGFYTSRPTLKQYIRYASNFLQVCKQLDALDQVGVENNEQIEILRRAVGEAQHHDAITGTSKQRVAHDYEESLYSGIEACEEVIQNAFQNIGSISGDTLPSYQFCHLLNVSVCETTENSNSFAVTIQNSLGMPLHTYIRVPVKDSSYEVTGPQGETVASGVIPVSEDLIKLLNRSSDANNELVFPVDLPPLGYKTYFARSLTKQMINEPSDFKIETQSRATGDIMLQNEYLSVIIDETTGLLKEITDLTDGTTYNVRQSLHYYHAMPSFHFQEGIQASGAYIFRPNGTAVPIASNVTTKVVMATGVQEVHQTYSDWASQIIRLYDGESSVEFEWLVGHIPVDDRVGKEVITLLETDFDTNAFFYTDSNGREVLERRRDFRPTWEFNITEPISGNYYPVNSFIYIKDTAKNKQLTYVTDRPQGGSSIDDGNLEIMLHRRLLHDDLRGVFQPLNERGEDGEGLVARGKYSIIVSTIDEAPRLYRELSLKKAHTPVVAVAPLPTTADDWIQQFRTEYSGLKTALPANVHLLTLASWKDNTLLLRLEHFYEKSDGFNQSARATVNLQDLFTPFTITNAEETTLGANRWLSQTQRMHWTSESMTKKYDEKDRRGNKDVEDPLVISLNPMQIRTLVVTLGA